MNTTVYVGPPQPTGRTMDLVLTGKCFPWKDGQPVLIHMIGSPLLHLPLFDNPEQMRALLGPTIEWDSVQMVEDGPEFIDSIPLEVIIVTNLRTTPEGRLRYVQVLR